MTTSEHRHEDEGGGGARRGYLRFAAMIATSTVAMFLLTYTNVIEFAHARFSEERVYMAILMGAAMAIVMLGFMWGQMYRDTRVNIGIVVLSIVVGVTALWLSRSQQFVEDPAYMGGMIPHHSIAILTSERADIDDVRVRRLADEIIKAQRREIKEMDWLLDDIAANGVADSAAEAERRPMPSFDGELDPEAAGEVADDPGEPGGGTG